MEIVVNGESLLVPEAISVAGLLEHLQLAGKHVAVEVNLQIVPRQRHAEHQLRAGDRLEVVTLVGGG